MRNNDHVCEHPADGDDEMCAECRSEHEPCCERDPVCVGCIHCPCGNYAPSSDVN